MERVKIVTIKADEIDAKMASEGRIALYGIFSISTRRW